LLQILFAVLCGAINMGMATPHLEAIAMARGSATAIFAVLDRVPKIDSLSQAGHKPARLQGHIQLQDIHFEYPARLEVKVSYVYLSDALLANAVHFSYQTKIMCSQEMYDLYDST
jgi:ABC-type multidrug transport system fused ATPase/permease subunit